MLAGIEKAPNLLDSDSDGDNEDTDRLPWGVRKKLIEAAPPGCDARPRIGDEVSVHFVSKLQDGGKQIGAAKDDKNPFRFVIGKQPRQVVEGFELGVQTMKRGEIAEFTVAPRYAYDDLGSPPLVPPDATLVFEIKLIDWECKMDLFQDGRAVKTIVERGSGELKPHLGQDVLMSLRVKARGGKILEEYEKVEHSVGSPDFGLSSKIVSQALLHMVEGEQASVFLRRFAGDTLVDRTLQGATLELNLLQVYEARDVSPLQDGSLVKKILRKGTGKACPPEASRVRVVVSTATDGSGPVAGFAGEQALEFKLGDGEVCDELEFAVAEMKLGEQAVLTCHKPGPFAEPRLGLSDLKVQKLMLTLELASVTEDIDATRFLLSQQEKLSFAAARKDVAAALFKRQRYMLALVRYNRILAFLASDEGEADDNNVVKQMRCTCELNRAACLLKLEDNSGARVACDKVLAIDPEQIKALYRRGVASFALSDYVAAQKDLAKVLRLDPKNSDARSLLVQVKEAQRRYAEDAKSTAARMCGRKLPEASSADLVEKDLKASSHTQLLKPIMAFFTCFPLSCNR